MKRGIALVLVIFLAFAFIPVSSAAGSGKVQADAVKIDALMKQVSAEHKKLVTSTNSFQGIDQYIVSDPASAALLSSAEIQKLITPQNGKERLTNAQAAADVDLFFRAFQSAYGGYAYFGQEAWDEAKAEMTSWLKERRTIQRAELEKALCSAVDFLQDAHVSIGNTDRSQEFKYAYFYCEGQNYYADKTGYYKIIDSEKWYFVSFSDKRVSMQRSLTRSGEIVYSPVLFCPESGKQDNSTVTLKNASGSRKKEKLTWVRNQSYWDGYYDNSAGFQLLDHSGVAYLSLRSCNNYFGEEMRAYAATGTNLRNASLIIFDIRANGGGSELYSREWVMNLTDYVPVLPLAGGTRYSKLRTAAGFDNGQVPAGTFERYEDAGDWIENEIPIIVLIDEYVASAGESTLNYLRSMDNVLVVGSNSNGAQLCGNVMDLFLPNSGIRFRFGTGIGFQYDTTNKDFRGYEPDIWCNPRTALDDVMKMVKRYGMADATQAASLSDEIKEQVPTMSSIRMRLVIQPMTGELDSGEIKAGDRTGMPEVGAAQVWMVFKDGVPRDDYTVTSANTNILQVTPIKINGTMFEARTMRKGTTKFYVTVDGETAEFVWYAG